MSMTVAVLLHFRTPITTRPFELGMEVDESTVPVKWKLMNRLYRRRSEWRVFLTGGRSPECVRSSLLRRQQEDRYLSDWPNPPAWTTTPSTPVITTTIVAMAPRSAALLAFVAVASAPFHGTGIRELVKVLRRKL
ncbi:uncharacterized protein [Panulirus ornatus]|uniref:uncharacterized protein isoform X1 n=1 Tax=Panulirus ornatus TaxID=150431 RepID=UPI003A850EF1